MKSVRFADIWQRRGFMNMPEELQGALFRALFAIPDIGGATQAPDVAVAFSENCRRWIDGTNLKPEEHRWEDIRKQANILRPAWQYDRPTVMDVVGNPLDVSSFAVTGKPAVRSWRWHQ